LAPGITHTATAVFLIGQTRERVTTTLQKEKNRIKMVIFII